VESEIYPRDGNNKGDDMMRIIKEILTDAELWVTPFLIPIIIYRIFGEEVFDKCGFIWFILYAITSIFPAMIMTVALLFLTPIIWIILYFWNRGYK